MVILRHGPALIWVAYGFGDAFAERFSGKSQPIAKLLRIRIFISFVFPDQDLYVVVLMDHIEVIYSYKSWMRESIFNSPSTVTQFFVVLHF